MPRESVENILGIPDKIEVESDGEMWRYSRDGKWIMVDIYFDSKGKVKSVEIDR